MKSIYNMQMHLLYMHVFHSVMLSVKVQMTSPHESHHQVEKNTANVSSPSTLFVYVLGKPNFWDGASQTFSEHQGELCAMENNYTRQISVCTLNSLYYSLDKHLQAHFSTNSRLHMCRLSNTELFFRSHTFARTHTCTLESKYNLQNTLLIHTCYWLIA